MGRAMRSPTGASAGQVAARRRVHKASRGDSGATTSTRTKTTSKNKPRHKSKGGGLRGAMRLLVLAALMALIGFFGVLVLDVGTSLLGRINLGPITLTEVFDKVVDRLLDRDVPRVADPKPVVPAKKPRPKAEPVREPVRAPERATRPEDDARHVTTPPRPDPQVQEAQQRLDDLIGRIGR